MILQDWDEIEALRASLREHMVEIHRLRAAGRQALDTLERAGEQLRWQSIGQAQHDLRAALAETASQESRQVEPVAWITPGQELHLVNYEGFQDWTPLYLAPPKREPLTEEKIAAIYWKDGETLHDFARAIERAHGIGGE